MNIKVSLNKIMVMMWFLILLNMISINLAFKDDLMSSNAPTLKMPLDSPDFVGPIKNVTVAIGREAVLSCSIMNLGQYKVGWMKADDRTILSLHTRVITHNPRITVTHDESLRTWQLRIRQLKESDRGCYMCQINTGEMKKQLGCVDVLVPPDIDDVGTSSDLTVNEGENVTLSCRARGHPQPRILWRREDNDYITLQLKPHEIQRVDSYSGPDLQLIRVNHKQMGAYFCIASNDVPPAVSKRVTLWINFAPKIQIQKPLVGATRHSNVKLKCDIEAFPISSNYWIKDGNELIIKGAKYNVQERNSGYRMTMVLTIVNFTTADMATYTCIVSNTLGQVNGSIRLYEIKLTTTTISSSTAAITTTTEKSDESNLILEITNHMPSTSILSSNNLTENTADDPSRYWFNPSVPSIPLELETSSIDGNRGAINLASIPFHSKIVVFALLVLLITR